MADKLPPIPPGMEEWFSHDADGNRLIQIPPLPYRYSVLAGSLREMFGAWMIWQWGEYRITYIGQEHTRVLEETCAATIAWRKWMKGRPVADHRRREESEMSDKMSDSEPVKCACGNTAQVYCVCGDFWVRCERTYEGEQICWGSPFRSNRDAAVQNWNRVMGAAHAENAVHREHQNACRREELLEALERIARLWERDADAPAVDHSHNMYDARCIARAAIRKAKGETP